MPRAHVSRIETNLKIGGAADLGLKTLVVGPNASGKSTLVNGLEAAGSGRVSDVAGRASLAKDSDLSMLGDSIFARATLSDGTSCAWYLEKGHRAKRIGPEISFPLRAVREALLGEPDKARKWILLNGGSFEWNDVEQLVPELLRRKLASLVWDDTACPTPSDRLVQAITDTAQRKREAKARAKAKPQAPAGPPPTDAEIKAAQDAVIAFSAVGHLTRSKERLDTVEGELKKGQREVRDLEAREIELNGQLLGLPQTSPISEVARAALTVVEAAATSKAKSCAICGSPTDPATMAARAAKGRAFMAETLKTVEKRAQLDAALSSIRGTLQRSRGDIARLEAEAVGLREVIGSTTVPEGDPESAKTALAALHSRRAAWQAVRSAETDAVQAERDALEWEQLGDALSKALGSLVEQARKGFEARVQRYLPEGWRFGVDLLDGDREVLRVGLRPAVYKEGLPSGDQTEAPVRAALSGAEWATVTAALALATAPEEGPVVIAPEERAFDRVTLGRVLDAFAAVAGSAQVVITSPVEPEDCDLSVWTIVRTGQSAPPIVAPNARELAEMARADAGSVAPATRITEPAPNLLDPKPKPAEPAGLVGPISPNRRGGRKPKAEKKADPPKPTPPDPSKPVDLDSLFE